MKKLVLAAVLAALATPAFAQTYSSQYGTGNILPFAYGGDPYRAYDYLPSDGAYASSPSGAYAYSPPGGSGDYAGYGDYAFSPRTVIGQGAVQPYPSYGRPAVQPGTPAE